MSMIGFIGLGAMGSRIAARLIDAGHQVYGTNRTPEKAQPLIERCCASSGRPSRTSDQMVRGW
jgi:3-hydroxyisobutyrate dehydrogenase-like beta-hydroxyacid dehydrogenase